MNFRWIPEKNDSGQIFSSLRYEFIDGFTAGIDYRPLVDDFALAANYRIVSENSGWQPSVILGTSNDEFNDVQSQSYYGTISKSLGKIGDFNFSPYLGLAFIEELSDLRPVGGLHIRRGVWSTMLSYSGTNEHFTLSRQLGNHTASLVYWGLKYPGVAWTYRF